MQQNQSAHFTVRKMARAAIIAAVYVTLCLVLAPFSYGPVQVRVSEALTLLPILCPEAILGVTLGCLLANIISGVVPDMVIGTLATLLAALATHRLRGARFQLRPQGYRMPLLASLPPVLINAVFIGAELTWLYFPAGSPAPVWLFNMLTVGLGQLASCCGLGLLLVWAIEKKPALLALFADKAGTRP